ncbi:hypothetical protein PTO0441 [Picrophilus oshimae DSM 9789]|uniref:Uncharacterized protein n=1 Tax=Picrophilus torridus (strain ATCC 700027 / DSM 9790 / JCM 10055 / NBRC 100828 / KAW 2/3) TaxID=1122961 RepID=Q6L1X6_PICTO|nr:hypothetical protein PTO0441 [Picrophilus oshimae DSM 9789]
MDIYSYFWLVIKYIFPLALLIISIVFFNPLLIMISIVWIVAAMAIEITTSEERARLA